MRLSALLAGKLSKCALKLAIIIPCPAKSSPISKVNSTFSAVPFTHSLSHSPTAFRVLLWPLISVLRNNKSFDAFCT